MSNLDHDDASSTTPSTVVGSETGYRMALHEEPEEDPSEDTTLLGAGAQDRSIGSGRPFRKDSWVGFEDFDGLPWWRKPSVYWLLAPYALFTLAFGGSIVPKLNLIVDLVCKGYFADRAAHDPKFTFAPIVLGGDNPQCFDTDEVQRQVAVFGLILNVVVGTLSAFSAPKLGSLSDRYGRTPMLAICSLGGIAGEIITILAAKYPETVHYRWMIAGSVLDGLAGSFTAGSVLTHSYTSDCTPPSKRAVSMGFLHACLYTGLAFGPLIASFFVQWAGSLVSVFYVTLGCHIFFVLFVAFVVPESLSRKRQVVARERFVEEQDKLLDRLDEVLAGIPYVSSGPWSRRVHKVVHSLGVVNPFAPLKVLFPSGPRTARLRRNLVILAFIDMMIVGAAMSVSQVSLLYIEKMFGWRTVESSRFVSLTSMVRVLVLVVVFPIINWIFRGRLLARQRRESAVPIMEKNEGCDEFDIWVLRSALLSDVIGAIGFILATGPHVYVAAAMVTALGGLGSATIQSSISKHMPAERIGALLGSIGLLHALSRIVWPIAFNGLYAATVGTYPQAIFVLLGSLFLGSLIASAFIRPHVFMPESDELEEEAEEPLPNTSARVSQDVLEDEELLLGFQE